MIDILGKGQPDGDFFPDGSGGARSQQAKIGGSAGACWWLEWIDRTLSEFRRPGFQEISRVTTSRPQIESFLPSIAREMG